VLRITIVLSMFITIKHMEFTEFSCGTIKLYSYSYNNANYMTNIYGNNNYINYMNIEDFLLSDSVRQTKHSNLSRYSIKIMLTRTH
jgi:hypothetical protein